MLFDTTHVAFRKGEDDKMAIILAHINDLLLAGRPFMHSEKVNADLSKAFNILDQGMAKMFLGVEINWNQLVGMLKIL